MWKVPTPHAKIKLCIYGGEQKIINKNETLLIEKGWMNASF